MVQPHSIHHASAERDRHIWVFKHSCDNFPWTDVCHKDLCAAPARTGITRALRSTALIYTLVGAAQVHCITINKAPLS